MKKIISILAIITIVHQSFGQYTKSRKYSKFINCESKNLKTKKVYSVARFMQWKDGKYTYKINGKEVTDSIYNKYGKNYKTLKSCRPCIIKSFDENDSLIREAVSYKGVDIGWFKEFYENGNLKLTGNNSGNIKNGQWVYFSEQGDTLYSEYWENGKFIKQIPEQNKTEIWTIEFSINGEPADKKTIFPNQLKEIVITPKFKNNSRDSANLMAKLNVSSGDYGKSNFRHLNIILTLDSLKTYNLNKALLEKYFLPEEKLYGYLSIDNNEKYMSDIYINIVNQLSKKSTDSIYSLKPKKIPSPIYQTYIINLRDSTKKIKIKNNMSYELTYSETKMDSISSETHTLSGYIETINDTSIDFELFSESVNLKLKNGFSSRTEKYYPDFSDSVKKNIRNINTKYLTQIDYSSPSRNSINAIGVMTTLISVMTTFIVAPLISINYKNGDFNKDKYFKVGGIGLIGLSVGIPLNIIGRSKTYNLTAKNISKGKDYWYLESQVVK